MENLNKYCVQYTKQKLLSATLIRSLIGFKVTCRRSHKEKFLHQNVERVWGGTTKGKLFKAQSRKVLQPSTKGT
ncbi:Uncharacterized protein APZ42_014621 [Daphnia magna]|uniref:Uncharacterized protein n=1 Tax=Daphnia magna TaxID=35525 RepID=A0A162PS22_9CRUS|nr:Uncharacterized protein APZ42_014621 [Daphnia magna]